MNLRTSKYNDHLSFCSPNPSEEFCKADHHKPNLTQRGRERGETEREREREETMRVRDKKMEKRRTKLPEREKEEKEHYLAPMLWSRERESERALGVKERELLAVVKRGNRGELLP